MTTVYVEFTYVVEAVIESPECRLEDVTSSEAIDEARKEFSLQFPKLQAGDFEAYPIDMI
jgi:hypothetical protein